MESAELLIVGCGPAGLSAATGYRDAGGAGSVLLVGNDAVHPYARPPLSKDFLRGDSSEDSLPLKPSARFAEQAVAVRLSQRVEGLDPGTRTATLDGGQGESHADLRGGDRTLRYAAWGDGYDTAQLVEHNGGGLTAWYTRGGATVGVATHEADQDYELGRQLIERGEPAPVTARAQARSEIP